MKHIFAALFAALAGITLTAAELQNPEFKDGLKGWVNGYSDIMDIQPIPGGVKLTVKKFDAKPGAILQYVKVAPNTEMICTADYEAPGPKTACLQIKLIKNRKEKRYITTPFNLQSKGTFTQKFNTADADTICVLVRTVPKAAQGTAVLVHKVTLAAVPAAR